MITVVKSDLKVTIDFQLDWYERNWMGAKGKRLVPANIKRVSDVEMSYKFVDGVHPTRAAELAACHTVIDKYLWGTSNSVAALEHRNITRYVAYVIGTALVLFEQDDSGLRNRVVTRVLRLLDKDCVFTPAKTVHGDCTVENLLYNPLDGNVVLIDPAASRGMYCRELDESKMMQSYVTQWEVVKRGWRMPDSSIIDLPFKTTKTHWLLLLTHWIRLLGHPEKHDSSVLATARTEVIPDLIENIDQEVWNEIL